MHVAQAYMTFVGLQLVPIGSHHGWDCNGIGLVGLQWNWILLVHIMDGIAMGLVHIMDEIAMRLTWWDCNGIGSYWLKSWMGLLWDWFTSWMGLQWD